MTECVLHHGKARNSNGYGMRKYRGRTIGAHRARFHEVFGWWPPVVRHTCDNRACVNPWHLIPGTQADNVADMVARGRSVTMSSRPGMPPRSDRTYDQERRARIKAGTW